jgi:hypothetical protein
MKGFISLVSAGVFGLLLFTAAPAIAAPAAPTPGEPQRQFVTAGNFEGELVGQWTDEAKKGWTLAVEALDAQIKPKVPIQIIVKFEPLEPNVLGRGGATKSAHNTPGVELEDTWYPIALANHYAGTRLAPGPDIQIWLNSIMPWNYNGDPKLSLAQGKPDFVTTVTHEILHGMGINGTARVVDGAGYWGDEDGEFEPEELHTLYWYGGPVPDPLVMRKGLFNCSVPAASQPKVRKTAPKPSDDFKDVYDNFVVDGDGNSILDTDIYPDPSGELNDLLTSEDLWWDGEEGTKANGGKRIKLYAPDPWKPGSSYAHFDDDTYDGGEDALMTAAGAKIPDLTVGPRLVGVLKDLGWAATPAKR